MRNISFSPKSFAEYNEWSARDKQVFERLKKMLIEISREPFVGTGKPEPLKHDFAGCWSRRLNKEHRIVYRVTEDEISVLSVMYHYT